MEYEEFCEMVSQEAKARHRNYLNSFEWKTKRELIIERDKGLCQDCLSIVPEVLKLFISFKEDINKIDSKSKAHEVHHLNYSSLHTSFEIDDCISLCDLCHKLRHCHTTVYREKLRLVLQERIIKRVVRELNKLPKYIDMMLESRKAYMKSITMKPNDWLNEEVRKMEVRDDEQTRS